MVGAGRTIGLIAIGIGVIIVLGAAIFVFGAMNQKGSTMQSGGAALTMCLALVVGGLIAGAGVWFMMQGRTESTQFAEVEKEQRILNIVSTQGTVSIANMAIETNLPLDKVKAAIYDLVGKGLFTGYVDWKAGKLVSADAAVLNQAVITGKCPNCGAPQVVAGKGVVRCDYCGAEFFLPPQMQAQAQQMQAQARQANAAGNQAPPPGAPGSQAPPTTTPQ